MITGYLYLEPSSYRTWGTILRSHPLTGCLPQPCSPSIPHLSKCAFAFLRR